MSQLQGQAGELSFTVQIRRAATGQVEEHQLVGRITADQAEALGLASPPATEPLNTPNTPPQDHDHGRHP